MAKDFDQILQEFEEALMALNETDEELQERTKVMTIINDELMNYAHCMNNQSSPKMIIAYTNFLKTDKGRLAIYKDYLTFVKIPKNELLNDFAKVLGINESSSDFNWFKSMPLKRLAVVMAVQKCSDCFIADLNKMA